MLATTRLAMVALFALWVALDPAQPARNLPHAGALFGGYALVAMLLLLVARRSWWWDHRLTPAAFAIDVGMFFAGLYATEAVTLDLFSVFITFFAFLVLGSAARWGQGPMVGAAACLMLSFVLAGLALAAHGIALDWARFARRLAYLALLAALLVWFARTRPAGAAPRLAAAPEAADLLESLLAYAMRTYGAGTGLIAWLDEGAVQPQAATANGAAPDLPGLGSATAPFLFDCEQGRRLTLVQGHRPLASTRTEQEPALLAFPEPQGLAVPFQARGGRGLVLLGAVPGLCADDLAPARALASEIARASDDAAAQVLAREVALARLRSQLATDLHDSVAQTLAGVQFRLEALMARVAAGLATAEEVTGIAQGVAAEQQHVRALIEQLRQGTPAPGQADLRHELLALTRTLGAQWQLTIELAADGTPVLLPPATVYQVQQIVREGVANAARHGRASHVAIDLAPDGHGGFVLDLCDNGTGFAAASQVQPRSLRERAVALGGALQFTSIPGETRVRIAVPGDPA